MLFCSDLSNGTYRNPVLYGDYSDPDVIRTGSDYYMISSSFTNTPGIPVLHSKDLVNWQVVNYAVDNLPGESYRAVRHGCGIWAPSIRFHEGMYYIYFPMPDEGIYVCKTANPLEKWSEPVCILSGKGYIDPCPFWDEDGKAYLICALAASRAGRKSVLLLAPMTWDGMSLTDCFECIFDGNNSENDTIEGPKLYKRNGYYYIFAPSGGVKAGHQAVLRSTNITGPYEYRIALKQGNSPVNGPHQGGWVDTPEGEDFFLHFQDVYAGGRIVHLQPMRWEDDWPVIGKAGAGETCGEPVMTGKKPAGAPEIKKPFRPDCSDDFKGSELGLQWQWNANYSPSWYRMLSDGMFLSAFPTENNLALCDCPSLLLQKWPAPEFVCKTVLDYSSLKPGECAGIVSLGTIYAGLGIRADYSKNLSGKSTENSSEASSDNSPSDPSADSSAESYEKKHSIVLIHGRLSYSGSTSSAVQEEKILPLSEEVFHLCKNRMEFTLTVRITGHEDYADRTDYLGRTQWVRNVPKETITLSLNNPLNPSAPLASFEIPALAGRWVGVKNGIFCIKNTAGNTSDGGVVVKNVVYDSL